MIEDKKQTRHQNASSTKQGAGFFPKEPVIRKKRGIDNTALNPERGRRIGPAQSKKDTSKYDIKMKTANKGRKLKPVTLAKAPWNEDVPGNAVAQGGVNMAPNAMPKLKAMHVTDRRHNKKKTPVMLKRFRTHANLS